MDRGGRSVGVVLALGLMLAAASPARGLVWSVQRTPMDAPEGVSCVSARVCTAVGEGAMGWDGRRWRLDAAPGSEPAGSSLAGVSCNSSKLCVAVGEYIQSYLYDPNAMKTFPVSMPLAERWTGVGWELLPFPSFAAWRADGRPCWGLVHVRQRLHGCWQIFWRGRTRRAVRRAMGRERLVA